MWLDEIPSEWILSRLIFLLWTLTQVILSQSLLQLKNAISGSLPMIIAIVVGGSSTFLGSYYLWLQQQKKEMRTLASAFIIDLERIYNSNYYMYLNYTQKWLNFAGFVQAPGKKFYDNNGAYFLFANEIYKLGYDLSTRLLAFYDELLIAEFHREFLSLHLKNGSSDYRNADELEKFYIDSSDMILKSCIISTEEKILDLRNQLKKIRDK